MGRTWTEEQKQEQSERQQAHWADKKAQDQAKANPKRKKQPQGKMANYVFTNELDPGQAFIGSWQGVKYDIEHGDKAKLPVDLVAYHDATFQPSDTPKRVKVDPDDYPEGTIIPDRIVVRQNRFRFTWVGDVEDKRFKDKR